jgi:hypothetical protein
MQPVPVPVDRVSRPVSPVGWAIETAFGHGAGGKFNSFSIFKNDSNPFQLQKFISNSIFV